MKEFEWHIAHTRPQRERKVSDLLIRKGFTAFCPLNKIEIRYGPKRKLESHPLFPSFVFVSIQEHQRPVILQTSGVINFVHWLCKPAVIDQEEIRAIRVFLDDYPQVSLEKTVVNTNSSVQVINDARVLRKGNLMEITNPGSKLILPSLGYIIKSDAVKETNESFIRSDESSLRPDEVTI